ncbi:hypothetical protein NOZE110980_17695 [Nocardioides zeicaulis]
MGVDADRPRARRGDRLVGGDEGGGRVGLVAALDAGLLVGAREPTRDQPGVVVGGRGVGADDRDLVDARARQAERPDAGRLEDRELERLADAGPRLLEVAGEHQHLAGCLRAAPLDLERLARVGPRPEGDHAPQRAEALRLRDRHRRLPRPPGQLAGRGDGVVLGLRDVGVLVGGEDPAQAGEAGGGLLQAGHDVGVRDRLGEHRAEDGGADRERGEQHGAGREQGTRAEAAHDRTEELDHLGVPSTSSGGAQRRRRRSWGGLIRRPPPGAGWGGWWRRAPRGHARRPAAPRGLPRGRAAPAGPRGARCRAGGPRAGR